MVLFIRDNECFEPRVHNYLRYFNEHEIEYRVIAWNRNGHAKSDEHISFFERRAEYGMRIANIPNKIAWMLFVIKEIFKNRKECTVIHACDIDTILPALLLGKILNKKVIFDVFDWISSSSGKGSVYKLIEWLQNYAYKHSDYIILCEEERKAQARAGNSEVHILPNIPDGKTICDENTLQMTQIDMETYKYVISYVGVFDRDRGLENLLQCVSQNSDICLNIAGFGVLGDLVNQYAEKHSNIVAWGRVEYAVGQAIMKNSSLIAAMYHLTNPVHKYAAPNKYYESLVLEVPMITTENTLVGSKVKKYNTGFILDESFEALNELLRRDILNKEIIEKKKNCHNVWSEVYADYYDAFMQNVYTKMIV